MTKKEREKFFERIRANADRFCLDVTTLDKSEVNEMLAASGIDTNALRKQLHDAATELALKQRRKGNRVPRYLHDAIDMTRPIERVSPLEKAVEWLESFIKP